MRRAKRIFPCKCNALRMVRSHCIPPLYMSYGKAVLMTQDSIGRSLLACPSPSTVVILFFLFMHFNELPLKKADKVSLVKVVVAPKLLSSAKVVS